MNDLPTGRVEFFRSNGHWQMKVEAPAWIISDIVREIRVRGFHLLNNAGALESPTWTMLVGTSPGGVDPEHPQRNVP